eukprot:gene20616-7563_t
MSAAIGSDDEFDDFASCASSDAVCLQPLKEENNTLEEIEKDTPPGYGLGDPIADALPVGKLPVTADTDLPCHQDDKTVSKYSRRTYCFIWLVHSRLKVICLKH